MLYKKSQDWHSPALTSLVIYWAAPQHCGMGTRLHTAPRSRPQETQDAALGGAVHSEHHRANIWTEEICIQRGLTPLSLPSSSTPLLPSSRLLLIALHQLTWFFTLGKNPSPPARTPGCISSWRVREAPEPSTVSSGCWWPEARRTSCQLGPDSASKLQPQEMLRSRSS